MKYLKQNDTNLIVNYDINPLDQLVIVVECNNPPNIVMSFVNQFCFNVMFGLLKRDQYLFIIS